MLRSLFLAGVTACFVFTGASASFAQSVNADQYEMGQVEGQRRHDDCWQGDRRDRRNCRNEPSARPNSNDAGVAIGAGIIGLTIGAIIIGAASDKKKREDARNYDRWLADCSRRYRSFDPRSGTYIGRDGRRYSC